MKRLLLIVAGIGVLLAIAAKRPLPVTLEGRAMGCAWKLAVEDPRDLTKDLHSEIAVVLEHWEQVLSQWRPDSDLSRHNRGAAASPDLARVIGLAETLHRDTGGAFDHRLLEKVHAAGFGPAGKGLDLSSVGKGFAVDRVGELLRARGIERFVFSLAGEVLAGEGSWPVGIEAPDPALSSSAGTVLLSRQAMATSGNYRQWRAAENGRLVSHIIDPRTGRPVLRPPSGVTVIGLDTATASGWATALFVLGPEASSRAEERGMKVSWRFADQRE